MVLLLTAAAAILGGVVAAALGRGGEMAVSAGDFPLPGEGGMSAADVLRLRPTMSVWGYHAGAVDQALEAVARSMRERDDEIAALRREVGLLRAQGGAPPGEAVSAPGWPGTGSAATADGGGVPRWPRPGGAALPGHWPGGVR